MSSNFTIEEDKERIQAKDKLAKSVTLIVIDDRFLRAYIKKIFVEIIGIENAVECATVEEAKQYLNTHDARKIACIISSVNFLDGESGVDFIGYVRSTHRILAPIVLAGSDPNMKVEYVFLVKHFAGYIGGSFSPAKFIHMLLEVFEVRERRRHQRELQDDSKKNRPFNRLYEGPQDKLTDH